MHLSSGLAGALELGAALWLAIAAELWAAIAHCALGSRLGGAPAGALESSVANDAVLLAPRQQWRALGGCSDRQGGGSRAVAVLRPPAAESEERAVRRSAHRSPLEYCYALDFAVSGAASSLGVVGRALLREARGVAGARLSPPPPPAAAAPSFPPLTHPHLHNTKPNQKKHQTAGTRSSTAAAARARRTTARACACARRTRTSTTRTSTASSCASRTRTSCARSCTPRSPATSSSPPRTRTSCPATASRSA